MIRYITFMEPFFCFQKLLSYSTVNYCNRILGLRKCQAGLTKMAFLALFLIMSSVPSKAQQQQTLDDFLILAAENNPDLKSHFSSYLAAMEKIPQAKALPDPRVMFGYFIQPIETRVGPQRASLSISQSFPWFGTLKTKGNIAALQAESRLKGFDERKNQLFLHIRLVYNELYLLSKSIELTEKNLTLLSSFKELARVNFESGRTGFVNILRAEMEEKELSTKLDILKSERDLEKRKFEKLLNSKLSSEIIFPVELVSSAPLVNRDILRDSIISNNPKLSALRSQAEASQNKIELATLQGKPSFTVQANYIQIGSRPDINIEGNGKDAIMAPQIGLQLPINRSRNRAARREAIQNSEQVDFSIAAQEDELEIQLDTYLQLREDAQRRENLYQELLDLAQRTLLLLQTEFTTGQADFDEVLSTERQLLNYELALAKAQVDHSNSIHRINYLRGK